MLFFVQILSGQDIQVTSVPFPSYYTPSTIVDLDQDQYGNIWMVNTSQGMLKYNGEDFTIFTNIRNNSNSLISNRLECIHIDGSGLIWVGSFASGLSRYDPSSETFTHFVHDENDPNSISSNGVRSFVEDKNGGIWIGTLKGVNYWNPETEQFEDVLLKGPDQEILAEEHVRVLYIDKAGMIWAGSSSPFFGETSKGGLFKIDIRTYEVKRYAQSEDSKSITNNTVTAIHEDSRGNFWVGTSGDGLHTMDRELGEFTHHSYDPSDPERLSRSVARNYSYALDHIRFINEDQSGQIWIGTMGNGIARYDPITEKTTYLSRNASEPNKIPYDGLWSSLITDDNQMWFTGWGPSNHDQMFFKVNLDPLVINHEILNVPVFSFGEGLDGTVYLGSEDILFKLDNDETLSEAINLPGRVNSLIHINTDEKGNLWIATGSGLLYYSEAENVHQMYPIQAQDFGDELEVTYTDDWTSDSILVGTTAGLYLFDKNTEKFSYIPYVSDEIPDRTRLWVNQLRVDSRRNIWIGYSDFGLKKLSHDFKTFQDYTFLETVQDGPRAIYEDEYQNLYVGSRRSGLKKYDPENDTFSALMDQTGIIEAETGINSVKTVSENILWLMTGKGPVKYNLATNYASILDVQELNEYEITSRGLFSTRSGDYYLGTSNGFIKFKPEDFDRESSYKISPSISKMFVSDINYTDRIQYSGDGLVLNYDENNISFTLSLVNHLNASSTSKLEFKLENYDQYWRAGDNEEEVFYYNLDPGAYEFLLKSVDSLGGEGTKSIRFRIFPPWWQTWWAYCLYVIGFSLAVWIVHKTQKERTIKAEREKIRERELAQAKEIEKAYAELKATQAQLVQSEKMASLGELTAGIAHEIQNPLNFVNNFSDVNTELIEELVTEIKDGNYEDAIELAADIKANEEKIQHHGSRADSIVKGMLQHSRTNSGEKELTDINALCEEYVRLAYHGLRAKDHMFNADFKTDFAKLDKIEVIPQDLGRVLLNIITNAFHAVHEKSKIAQNGYLPEVKISTAISPTIDGDHDDVLISIQDNGPGIPEEIRDKIFQPFFTTKPTGEGTGLGLSLSYDIIKAHGGDLRVESEVGESTTFIVSLPTRIA